MRLTKKSKTQTREMAKQPSEVQSKDVNSGTACLPELYLCNDDFEPDVVTFCFFFIICIPIRLLNRRKIKPSSTHVHQAKDTEKMLEMLVACFWWLSHR